MKFVSCYNNPKVVPEKFSEPSMTDKTAFEPLSVTIERQLAAGKMAIEQGRGVYDFVNDGYIDPNRASTGSYYEPDLTEMSEEYSSAQSVYSASHLKAETKAETKVETKSETKVETKSETKE